MSTEQETKLDDHRKMLTLSKQLSDFQLENLKAWPFVVLPDISQSFVDYNFIDEQDLFYAGKVIFKITMDNKLEEQDLLTRCTFLADWTRILFWTDTQVEVFVNGKRVGHSI
jgi:hypothetical protein